MNDIKRYWLLSDRKTVREITRSEWIKLYDSKRHHRLAIVHDSELSLITNYPYDKGWIPKGQLEQIWGPKQK